MRIGILGAGESGIGAALLAKQSEEAIFVSDAGKIADRYKKELVELRVPFEEEGHHIENLESADLIIKSPGIPDKAKIIQVLKSRGKEVISEIEYGFRHCSGKILGITGSNGKTTTTRLCHHLLSNHGIKACMAGNVGTSFCRALVQEPDASWYVLELSSFQLDGIIMFRPDIGILLNITPDHLDRYDYKMENYARSKFRLAKNLGKADLLIYNDQDSWTQRLLLEYRDKGKWRGVTPGMLAQEKRVVLPDGDIRIPSGILQGKHNQFNLACAALAVSEAGVDLKEIEAALETFVNAPHRLELVGEWNGIKYINDSKATNVDAVYYALESMDRPVIWIAGGLDKGNDYSALKPLVAEKVRAMICLGIENRKLIKAFSTEVDKIKETTTLYEAVNMAASYAHRGDTVLLSPACASFDLFKNYKQRGDLFKVAVEEKYREESIR